MEVTDQYNALWLGSKRINILQGGRWSGKTYAACQFMASLAVTEKGKGLITGQLWPTLKKGVVSDWNQVINDKEIKSHIERNLPGAHITQFRSGSKVEFGIYQDRKTAKASGKRRWLFINEADSMPWEIAQELILGTSEKVFIDFNPNSEFWAHSKYRSHPEAQWFISTYRNNRFCPQSVIDEIEALKESDPELYKVYGEGKLGKISGQIFNVKTCQPFETNYSDLFFIDPGFSSSMLAMGVIRIHGRDVYCKELIYRKGLTDNDLLDLMPNIGIPSGATIIVDSAASQTIENLKRAGYQAFACKKGNVADELKTMRGYTWHIATDSPNWKKEADNYVFAKDMNGNYLSVPVKTFDHLWDGARYAFVHMNVGSSLPEFY